MSERHIENPPDKFGHEEKVRLVVRTSGRVSLFLFAFLKHGNNLSMFNNSG